MAKPRLLDLFCGAGGASMGYSLAGFDVTGVDIDPQPHYPFEFVQADALDYASELGHKFDAIHASPPCQAYAWSGNVARASGKTYPDLLPRTRLILGQLGKPYIIENVLAAPISATTILCGTMFGLPLIRHRKFESNYLICGPGKCQHPGNVSSRDYFTVAGHGGNGSANINDWKRAMDIDWMERDELKQAVPPAYTHYIGSQLIRLFEVSYGR